MHLLTLFYLNQIKTQVFGFSPLLSAKFVSYHEGLTRLFTIMSSVVDTIRGFKDREVPVVTLNNTRVLGWMEVLMDEWMDVYIPLFHHDYDRVMKSWPSRKQLTPLSPVAMVSQREWVAMATQRKHAFRFRLASAGTINYRPGESRYKYVNTVTVALCWIIMCM